METSINGLIGGKLYYYDTMLDSYGEFIKYEGKDCVFKPIVSGTYMEWESVIKIESDGSEFIEKLN